jgi:hypothetical protein
VSSPRNTPVPEFVAPIPFDAAVKKLGSKSPVASSLNSAAWSDLPAGLSDRAFFSSTVESARWLQSAQNEILDFLTVARGSNESGETFLKTSRAQFVERMQKLAQDLGIPATGPSLLQNPKRQARLELIFDTNLKSAQDFGYWQQGQDPDVLDAFPAQRFIRVASVSVPRPLHQMYEGEVRLKSDLEFWTGLNSPSIGGFGVPWGPWGFNSGMDVEDVSREEAERLNLISPGETPRPAEKDFNDSLQASTRGLSPIYIQHLQRAFGTQITITGDSAAWTNLPKPTPPTPEPKPTPPPAPKLKPAPAPKPQPAKRAQSAATLRKLLKPIDQQYRSATVASKRRTAINQALELIALPQNLRHQVDPAKLKAAAVVSTAASDGLSNALRFIHKKIMPKDTVCVDEETRSGSRSNYSPTTKRIRLRAGESASTMAHELMHWLEDRRPAIMSKSQAFLLKRAATGGPLVQLKVLQPWAGYGDSEITWPDQWEQRGGDPYMGKRYADANGDLYATEILSMGIERLIKNPLDFAHQDPEYFDYVVNTLRGL